MSLLEPVAMRLEVKEGQHGCTLINDSYNSDINSLDIALDFMSRRPDHKGRRHTLILSDIFQSGEILRTCTKRSLTYAVSVVWSNSSVSVRSCMNRVMRFRFQRNSSSVILRTLSRVRCSLPCAMRSSC